MYDYSVHQRTPINKVEYKMSAESSSELNLFSMLSHEFRTPMNGILGYVQLLQKTNLAGIQQLYVDELMICCVSLVKLVNDLLDFKKLENDRVKPSLDCLSVLDLTKEVSATTKTPLASKLQHLVVSIEPETPNLVNSDRTKIIQVLVNLITNAGKASPVKKPIDLVVGYNNKSLVFSVHDSGPGVPEEELTQIFDPFYQISNHEYSAGGAGLGLSISKKMAALLGGTIVVQNTSPGCTFTLRVPCEEANPERVDLYENARALEGVEVLLVDDEKANRIDITVHLHNWKMRPVICASPLEALTHVIQGRHNFGVALIDICMPRTPGDELARHIYDVMPSLPLIAMSSAETFDASMFAACIFKPPLDPKQLFAALCKVLVKSPCRINRPPTVPQKAEVSILIVEDNAFNERVLKDLFMLAGYRNTQSLSRCDEAWALVQKEQPRFIFLDLRMVAGPQGLWLLEKICEKFTPELVTKRVVIMSACLDPTARNKCASLGVQFFLEKPILWKDVSEILSMV